MISGSAFTPGRALKKKGTKAFVNRQSTEWWQKETKKLSSAQLCDRCSAVYFDGHWHTAPALAAAIKARRKTGKKPAKPVLCYECHVVVHGAADGRTLFEGQLTLDGLGDAAEKAEILSTVRNFAARMTKRDPEDRIINIDDRGLRVVVTTTENQMAVGMGKAVDAAFKGGKLRIAWSKDDLPARVYWTHKPS
jgi:hypothetical protein